MAEETKKCIECDRELFGRSDKKFCSDGCRSAYNNKMLSGNDSYIRKVNRILKKNRHILTQRNASGKTKTHEDVLRKDGFDFDFYTNVYVTKDNREYRYCYDQGYLMLDNGFMLLVRRDLSKS